jgi:dTDP-4-dehydrorhamnose 3,5-epimerase-like enzyme
MKLINLQSHLQNGGWLVSLDLNNDFPFPILRVFFVKGNSGVVRGRHAHKLCSQILICFSGKVEVSCTDGVKKSNFLLDKPSIGLIVPPGIWSEQKYLEDNSVLTVLCDRKYEEYDYLREYDEFIKFRMKLLKISSRSFKDRKK